MDSDKLRAWWSHRQGLDGGMQRRSAARTPKKPRQSPICRITQILDRGGFVGLWEYDVETESIAWMSLGRPNNDLEDAVKATESFIRADLGDARSFSLDSPKSRVPRIEAIRKAADR